MCGRYTLTQKPGFDDFDLDMAGMEGPADFTPRYNIAPGQDVWVVHGNTRGDTPPRMRWGLVPFWADDPKIGHRMINARSESAADKPAFRAAMKYRRCLLPADGFYEWEKRGDTKQPHLIRLADESPFCFAGLHEHWQDEAGNELFTVTVLTCAPNPMMKNLHDRMPVILPRDRYEAWLDPDQQDGEKAAELLMPYPADQMMHREVTTRVNSPRHDAPDLWQPPDRGLFA